MLVTPYICNTLYLAQKSPRLKLTSLVQFTVFIFPSSFHLSAKKPANTFFEGAISLKKLSNI